MVPQQQHGTTAGMGNFDPIVVEQQQTPFYEGLEFPNTSKELRVILKNNDNNIKVNILCGSVGNKLGVACAYSGLSKNIKAKPTIKKKVSADTPNDSTLPSLNLFKAKKFKQHCSASVKSDCSWRICMNNS